MLTARGWSFFLFTLVLFFFALSVGITPLAFVSGTLLVWFLSSWLGFLIRVQLAEGRLRLERELSDEHGLVRELWARFPVHVRVVLVNDGPLSLPHVIVIDRVPPLADRQEGQAHASGPLERGKSVVFDYRITPRSAGRLRFDGAKVLVGDLEGLFAQPLFVSDGQSFPCLPPLATRLGRVPAVKRINLLPLIGTHPHRRPGSGSDLLELRDYQPGDPPKLIAWKVSARRDRLMTRELESEVPIRCTLFVDVSDAVRVGRPGDNALSRLIEIAAAVAQANAGARDLTGLCLFDEERMRRLVRPERGSRHLVELIRHLADHADLLPRTSRVSLTRLIPLAYGLVQDLYPRWLDASVNAFPWWLAWWAPRPAYLRHWTKPPAGGTRVLHWLMQTLLLGPLGFLLNLPERLSRPARRRYRQRKQLAAILAVRYDLGPGGLAHLLEDDEACRDHLMRFLTEHQVPAPVNLYDETGRYAFASPGKVDVLAHALMGSILRGHDNELFVLLVDLLENDNLEPLLRAVRVAQARHHKVILLCPWPADVPAPVSRSQRTAAAPSSPDGDQHWLQRESIEDLVEEASLWRLQQAYDRLRQTFVRLGVQVVCAPQQDAVPLILSRLQHLRVLQRGVP